MADKIFSNVRLGLKVDSLENWGKSSLILRKGEVAFCTVAASAGTGLTEPVVMMKVGDGDHTFSELGFDFYAKASDVLAAAKSEEALTAFVNGVIAKAGIATDEAMQALAGKVTTAEGKITGLENELNTAETGLKARMTAAEGDISALEGLVGDKKVAIQISEAIAALDLANTYAAKALEQTVSDHKADTVSHVTAEDKVKWNNALQATDITKGSANGTISVKGTDVVVTGLGSAAFTESTAYDAAGAASTAESNAKAYAKEYADGLAGNYDAKGAAATAESNAKAYAKEYADGLAGNYDAAGSAADALDDAKDYTDSEMTRLVGDKTVGTQISEAITGLDLPNTYAAKVHKHVKADITDFAHEHVVTDITDFDEKVKAYDYATKAEAEAYANGKDAAIKAAKDAADAAQKDVDDLEKYVGVIPETAEATNIVAYVQEKTAGIATDTALEELTGRVATAEGKITTLEGTVGDASKGLVKAVADLETLVGDESVADRIATEKQRAEGIEGGLRTDVDAVSGKVTKLIGDDADKSVRTIANEELAKQLIAENAAESLNELQEIAAWIQAHPGDAAAMNKAIEDLGKLVGALPEGVTATTIVGYIQEAVAAEKSRAEGIEGGLDTRLKAVEAAVGETGSVSKAIEDAVTEVKGYTDDEIAKLTAEGGAVKANADAIDALEAKVGDKTVAESIAAVTDPLAERIVELEKVDHDHANKAELDLIASGDKAKWDAKLENVTAAADSGLKATKSGNTVSIEIDDSITFIFDCGDAGVTA